MQTITLSQARAFIQRHAALAYDDATNKLFWLKAIEQGATTILNGVTFPDGSYLKQDPLAGSILAS